MNRFQYIPLLLLTGFLACQKPTDAVKPGDPAKPSDTTHTNPSPSHGVVFDKGTPVGQPTQKVIGPEGGTLASADGTLKMTIPAGAVSKATTFTMQPVTPTLPGLIGGQSFRLLPEGQTFAQPITLQYHYEADSLDGTSAQALFMAYQGSDGYWKALLNTELDETAQTLTVTTKHFSDWGAFAQFTLDATPNVVFPGQSAALTLSGYFGDVSPLTPEGQEVELSQRKTLANPDNIRNWQLKGQGKLSVEASRTAATYASSTGMKRGSVFISVDIYNFLPTNGQSRKGAAGKAIVTKTIRIEGTFFRATIDGKQYDCKLYDGYIDLDDGSIHVGGDYATDKTLSIGINSTALTPANYVYYTGQPDEFDGKAGAGIYDGVVYNSWYYNCQATETTFSPGSVTIDAVDTINGEKYILGSCTGEVYHVTGGCTTTIKVTVKKFSAEFRVKLEED